MGVAARAAVQAGNMWLVTVLTAAAAAAAVIMEMDRLPERVVRKLFGPERATARRLAPAVAAAAAAERPEQLVWAVRAAPVMGAAAVAVAMAVRRLQVLQEYKGLSL